MLEIFIFSDRFYWIYIGISFESILCEKATVCFATSFWRNNDVIIASCVHWEADLNDNFLHPLWDM